MPAKKWLSVGLAFLSVSTLGEACGDKLLSAGRGARFQQWFLAKRPASILIYASGSGIAPALKTPEFQGALKRVGHKVEAVEDKASLARILRDKQFDLVLADLGDAGFVLQSLTFAPSKPTLLPVLFKPSKQQAAAVAKEHTYLIKAPGDILQHLDTIEGAMKARQRSSS